MFWGLIMEPSRRYTQQVERPFHVSMAALDLLTADNEPTQVMFNYDGRNYLLCTLSKDHIIQTPLDLSFQAGDKVIFSINGKGIVHLTGYLLMDDDILDDEQLEELSESESEAEVTINGKRKVAQPDQPSPKAKKSKTLQLLEEATENSDDSDDFNFSDVLNEEEDEDSGEEEEVEIEGEEEDGEEEEDDDLFESDDELIEEEEEDEVEPVAESPPAKKAQQNGVSPKQSKKQARESPVAKQKTPKPNKQQPTEKTPNAAKNAEKTPNAKSAKKDKQSPKQEKQAKGSQAEASPKQQRRTLEGGVVVEDLKVGTGDAAKPGRMVQVYYEGRLKSNNKMFDSARTGPGFKFRLGRQEVIKAWDVGVTGMKVGGKRKVICPPNMAYGQKGCPPEIPPNSALVFEVELKRLL